MSPFEESSYFKSISVGIISTDWEFRRRLRGPFSRLGVGLITPYTSDDLLTVLKALNSGALNLLVINVSEASEEFVRHVAIRFKVPICLGGSNNELSSFLGLHFEDSFPIDRFLQLSTDRADWELESDVQAMMDQVKSSSAGSATEIASESEDSASRSVLGPAVFVAALSLSVAQVLSGGLSGAQGFLIGFLVAYFVLLILKSILRLAVRVQATTHFSLPGTSRHVQHPFGFSVSVTRSAKEEIK